MNYKALDEALAYIETGDINLEYQMDDIINFAESFNFGEFEELVTEGINAKEAFSKIKEAVVNFLKKVKEWIIKVGRFIKNSALKLKASVSSKFNKNNKYKDEEIDTKECFQDKESLSEAIDIPGKITEFKYKKQIIRAIAPGYALIKFSDYLNTRLDVNRDDIFDEYDHPNAVDAQINRVAMDFFKMKFNSGDQYSKIWEEHVLKTAETKVPRRCKFNALAEIISNNLKDNIDTLSKIQDNSDIYEDLLKDYKEDRPEHFSASDYRVFRNGMHIAYTMFNMFSQTVTVIAKAVTSGNTAMDIIALVSNH